MRKNWQTAALALALAGITSSLRAQDVLSEAPVVNDAPVITEASEPMLTVVPRSFGADPDAGPIAKSYQITLASGIYLLQPSFQSDPALIMTRTGVPQSTQVDFSRHMVAAPAVWLGFVGARGWGVRARWFNLDQDASVIAASPPGIGLSPASPFKTVQTPVFGSATADGRLQIDSWELEGTVNIDRNCWCYLLGAGARYVHLGQSYNATVVDLAGNPTIASSHHSFNGAGPTFSFQGRRPVLESCFAFYGIVHGSVLFGSSSDDYNGVAPGAAAQALSRHAVGVLPIGELEIGGELSHCVHRCRFFFQTGFVGQVWWGGGSAANFDAINNAAIANSNFGLIGLAFRGGINF
jgi:hypothetical protein